MDPVGEFKILFQKIARKSARDDSISIQNICDHLNEVGMIKNGDGSLQDCHKALIHYDKLLVQQKFLVEAGRFTESEFVRFWFNCHVFFNSYDLTNSGQVTKDEFITKMNDLVFYLISGPQKSFVGLAGSSERKNSVPASVNSSMLRRPSLFVSMAWKVAGAISGESPRMRKKVAYSS